MYYSGNEYELHYIVLMSAYKCLLFSSGHYEFRAVLMPTLHLCFYNTQCMLYIHVHLAYCTYITYVKYFELALLILKY